MSHSESDIHKTPPGELTLPNPEDCANRIKHAEFGSHNYFFSWDYEVTKDLKVDWLTGRNICRRHCMDLVSIETRNENEFIKRRMIEVGREVLDLSNISFLSMSERCQIHLDLRTEM